MRVQYTVYVADKISWSAVLNSGLLAGSNRPDGDHVPAPESSEQDPALRIHSGSARSKMRQPSYRCCGNARILRLPPCQRKVECSIRELHLMSTCRRKALLRAKRVSKVSFSEIEQSPAQSPRYLQHYIHASVRAKDDQLPHCHVSMCRRKLQRVNGLFSCPPLMSQKGLKVSLLRT